MKNNRRILLKTVEGVLLKKGRSENNILYHKLFILILVFFISICTSYAKKSYPETAKSGEGILIITSERLEQSWLKFAEWKTKTGRPTTILQVAEIEKSYEGVDVQDKIRKCIQDYAAKGKVKWILLGGDSSPYLPQVPDRDSKHLVYGSLAYNDIPADSYYLSSKSWDANGDGVYGEWEKDKDALEYTNEKLSLGRVPVRTAEDVLAYTNKIIEYESDYPEANFSGSLVYTCTVQASCPKLVTSWDTVKEGWKGDGKHYFSHKTPWDEKKDGDFALSPKNLISLINKKETSKMHLHGHGFMPVWVLEGDEVVSAEHVRKLTNKGAYLCLTTVSCFTGQFDADLDPSITETMLRQPDAGAVIVIAPAREGVPIFHNPEEDMRKMVMEGKMDGTTTLMTSFWKYGLANSISAGEAFHMAKKEMTPDAKKNSGYHWCLSELNFLGDPSIDLRPQAPKKPSLTADLDGSILTVKTDTEEGKSLTIWQKGKFYQVRKTTENKTIKIELPKEFDSDNSFYVSVSGHGLNAVIQKIK